MWAELKPHGVDVLVLAPGATDTEAPVLQEIDKAQLPSLMAPADVAREALGHLGRGPVLVTGRTNRMLVRLLGALPRRVAVQLAGKSMKATLERSRKHASPALPRR